jgi:HPt (histidine-containing phosphotransfer) domain-containing protein
MPDRAGGPPLLLPFDGTPPSAGMTRERALDRCGGDGSFLARLGPVYRRSVDEQGAALLAASRGDDADAVRHWAHTLKGSLMTVGAVASAERAGRIERAASAGRLAGIAAQAACVVDEARTIAEHLDPLTATREA